MNKNLVYPPFYFLFTIFLMFLLNKNLPGFTIYIGRISHSLSGLFTIFGVIMIISAWRRISKEGISLNEYPNSVKLIKDGPYRYTRNPLFLGMILVLFGIYFLMGTTSPLIMIFIFGAVLEDKFIKVEENLLREKYGNEYAEYSSRVSRWFLPLTVFGWEPTDSKKNKMKDRDK